MIRQRPQLLLHSAVFHFLDQECPPVHRDPTFGSRHGSALSSHILKGKGPAPDHLRLPEIQSFIHQIRAWYGVCGLYRNWRIKKFREHDKTRGFCVHVEVGGRLRLFSRDHVLLQACPPIRVSHVSQQPFKGVGINNLIRPRQETVAVLNHGYKLYIARCGIVVTESEDVRAQVFPIGGGQINRAVRVDVRSKRDLVATVLGNGTRAAREDFNQRAGFLPLPVFQIVHAGSEFHVGVSFSHGITVGLRDGGHGLDGLGVRRTIHHGVGRIC